MKLYFHPASTTSRAVQMFAVDNGIALDYEVVDILTGAHMLPEFAAINPNCLVPVLEDGDFRLTESATINRYLADKAGSPAYPRDPQRRADVDEMTDWLNANFYKDIGYNLVYPQLFPHHTRPVDAVQAGTLEWGRQRAQHWLTILDQKLIGPSQAHLCGNEVTLADYLGAEILKVAEVVGCTWSAWPNVDRWMRNMKARPNWARVHEVIEGFQSSVKGRTFVTV